MLEHCTSLIKTFNFHLRSVSTTQINVKQLSLCDHDSYAKALQKQTSMTALPLPSPN